MKLTPEQEKALEKKIKMMKRKPKKSIKTRLVEFIKRRGDSQCKILVRTNWNF